MKDHTEKVRLDTLTLDNIHLKIIFKKQSLILLLVVISYLLMYLMNVYFAKLLSIAEYGDVVVILKILAMGTPLVSLGGTIAAIEFLPFYKILT